MGAVLTENCENTVDEVRDASVVVSEGSESRSGVPIFGDSSTAEEDT